MTTHARPRVFSGIQPTGALHLGNYIGAIRNWVKMQETTDGIYCIVDLHALTAVREPGEIRLATLDMAADLLAIGIDPERSILFVQSQVREHTELAWHLQCMAAYGELSRMTQFKDKADRADFISAGLFTYPTLQAADIVLYDTDVVPVGEDQRQHLEFTRDVVGRFNSRYGETLVMPEHQIPEAGARVMDLQHPENKMSKSANSPMGTVLLTDEPADIERKFKRAVTDNDGEVRYDPAGKPGVSNLLTVLAVATDSTPERVADGYTQYGPLKADAAAALIEMLRPIQKRRAELDPASTAELLHVGRDKAQAIAEVVMGRVRAAVNLLD
jgi:tryptophanyl-tRNA synthetase